MESCLKCNSKLKRASHKYCSNKCQADYQYQIYIKDWLSGLKDGNRGIIARNISKHLKRFLIEKYGEKCLECGWNQKHPHTGTVPLEVDHIDGSAENNTESNLRLICPNCHSLTSNFRNLNKGKGRTWRTLKYLKNS